MRFATKTVLCLAFSTLASAAYADSTYQPYYAESSTRENYQFSTAPAAVPAPSAPTAQQIATEDAETPIFHFNNALWASAGTSFLNYKESVKPIPDSEHGWLPSIAAGASYMTHSNTYFSLSGSDTLGNAHYNGALINLNTNTETPAQATTQETIYNIDGQIGQGIYATRDIMFMPYADVGYQHWKRDLNSSQTEIYQNFDLMGGMKLQVTPIDRLLLELHGAGGTTIGAHMDTGGERYNLGSAGVETAGGKIGIGLTPKIELFTTADYTHFRFSGSGSNIVTINNVEYTSMEPGSATNDTTVRIGIAYHFR